MKLQCIKIMLIYKVFINKEHLKLLLLRTTSITSMLKRGFRLNFKILAKVLFLKLLVMVSILNLLIKTMKLQNFKLELNTGNQIILLELKILIHIPKLQDQDGLFLSLPTKLIGKDDYLKLNFLRHTY